MAAKKKTGKKDIDDGEEALQAVLLADSFRKRMTPITYTTPKSLLPLVNVPILEYTLELLVSAGVKELFIVCCCHAEKIQEYVENSASCKQFQVSIIVAPACKSVGAAMREVDSRGKIRGDFILVNGDVVSNMKLEPALLAHKKRREEEKNKDAILTMVFKTVHPSHKTSLFPEVKLTFLGSLKACMVFDCVIGKAPFFLVSDISFRMTYASPSTPKPAAWFTTRACRTRAVALTSLFLPRIPPSRCSPPPRPACPFQCHCPARKTLILVGVAPGSLRPAIHPRLHLLPRG